MDTRKRLACIAAATAALTGGCAERELPVDPTVTPEAVTAEPEATGAVSAAGTASSLIAIEDALDRVIPALDGGGDAADALNDAFDRVADGLESGDPKLGKFVADAEAVVTEVADGAAAAWGPDLEVLRLALDAVSTADGGGRGGRKEN